LLNLIWKLVCLAALISILCLMATGRVVMNDIKDSTLEIKDKVEARIIEPYITRDSDSEEKNDLQE
jgi:hypothetical protein